MTSKHREFMSKAVTLYELVLPDLLAKGEAGKWLLMYDDCVAVCPTYQNALETGYKICGLETPFMVKEIKEPETRFGLPLESGEFLPAEILNNPSKGRDLLERGDKAVYSVTDILDALRKAASDVPVHYAFVESFKCHLLNR